MSKKNKDIQVIIEEKQQQINGQQVTIQQLNIGKKEIGRVIPIEDKKFSVEISGKQEAMTKGIEEGIEYIIRQWNLHE